MTALAVVPAFDPWAMWRDQWEASLHAENKAPLTITTYLAGLDRFTRWAREHEIDDATDVTRQDLASFFADMFATTTRRGKPASPAGVAKVFRELRIFFKYVAAVEGGLSPMAGMSAPKIPEQPVEIVTDDDMRALMAVTAGRSFRDRRDRALIRCMWDMGLRRAELHGITLADLDLQARTIRVHGKGRRDRFVVFGAKTQAALFAYVRARAKHRDAATTTALWLVDVDGTRHRGAIGYEGIRTMLKNRGDEAGVADLYPHRFRHTAAHANLRAGMEEGDLMRLMGWNTRVMVDRYGASAAATRAQESARALGVGDRV